MENQGEATRCQAGTRQILTYLNLKSPRGGQEVEWDAQSWLEVNGALGLRKCGRILPVKPRKMANDAE